MTVKELIEKLEDYNGSLNVLVDIESVKGIFEQPPDDFQDIMEVRDATHDGELVALIQI
jgi:hypothetical protein